MCLGNAQTLCKHQRYRVAAGNERVTSKINIQGANLRALGQYGRTVLYFFVCEIPLSISWKPRKNSTPAKNCMFVKQPNRIECHDQPKYRNGFCKVSQSVAWSQPPEYRPRAALCLPILSWYVGPMPFNVEPILFSPLLSYAWSSKRCVGKNQCGFLRNEKIGFVSIL